MSKWSIETRTRLIREVKRTQIGLNLLNGLRRITVKSIFYTKVDKLITVIIRSVLLKSETFVLFVNCRETQHLALVVLSLVSGFEKMKISLFLGKFENGHFWPKLTQISSLIEFLAKMCKEGFFSKKRLEHFFRAYTP